MFYYSIIVFTTHGYAMMECIQLQLCYSSGQYYAQYKFLNNHTVTIKSSIIKYGSAYSRDQQGNIWLL